MKACCPEMFLNVTEGFSIFKIFVMFDGRTDESLKCVQYIYGTCLNFQLEIVDVELLLKLATVQIHFNMLVQL